MISLLLFVASGVLFWLDWVPREVCVFFMVASVAWMMLNAREKRHAEVLKAIRESKSV
jgi:hypothetical protein